MRKLERVLDGIDKVSEWTGKPLGFIIIILMVIVTFSVITRYAFNNPQAWTDELCCYLFGIAWLISGAFVLLQNQHIRVDVVYEHLSARWQTIMDLVTFPLFLIFTGVLLWQGIGFAADSISTLEHSRSLWRPPIYPIKVFIPIGAFLILIQGLARFIRDLIAVRTGKKREYPIW